MGNPLSTLLAMLQGSPMSRLPAERRGVRPGFGLSGAGIQPSDLLDQLRNADRKDAMVPLGPRAGSGTFMGGANYPPEYHSAISRLVSGAASSDPVGTKRLIATALDEIRRVRGSEAAEKALEHIRSISDFPGI